MNFPPAPAIRSFVIGIWIIIVYDLNIGIFCRYDPLIITRRVDVMAWRQRGVTLIELILVIGLMAIMTLLSFYEKQTDLEQARARQVGGFLYQYNNAVRSALAQGLITSTTTRTGTDWLKNSTCGGTQAVGEEFLSCDFPTATIADPISFGRLSLATTVIVSGVAPNRTFTATTITSPFKLNRPSGVPEVRADLSGIASLSAAAALTSGFQSGAGALSPYTATTDSSYKSDPKTAKITMVASNSANNDVWLRTDGGNNMHASLRFDGANSADRSIFGASSIMNLAGQILLVGSGSGLTAVTGAGVVIDAAAEVLGDFRVRRSLVVDNGASVTGNLSATGSVSAQGNVTANGNAVVQGSITSGGVVQANGNVLAQSNVIAQGNVTSNGSISAAGNVTASGALVGQIFYDSNDMGYYVDPHATTNLNSMAANYIASNGRIRAAEFVELGGIANEGTGCSPNGLLARSATGGALTCDSGLWTKMGGAAPTCVNINIPGYSSNDVTTYSCPSGYTKLGWDTTGQGWRQSSTPGIIIGANDYSVIFCCKF